MGIANLWTLLDTIGRRISVESLRNKVLAVDASIWMIQFVKAMRDKDGKMIRNAHLLGVLRRVLHLLFHRIKPIFVFDGGTPLLKLKTIAARRRRKEQTSFDMKQTAQRLFLNQLKQQQHNKKKKQPDEEMKGLLSTFHVPEETKEEEKSSMQETPSLSPSEEEEDESDSEFDPTSIQEWMKTNKSKQDATNDFKHLSSLPPNMQKEFIANVEREHRQSSRSLFLPLAGKPQEYSHAQMNNFLKTSALNRKIKAAKAFTIQERQEGYRIDSESNIRYILEQPESATPVVEEVQAKPKNVVQKDTPQESKVPKVSLEQYMQTLKPTRTPQQQVPEPPAATTTPSDAVEATQTDAQNIVLKFNSQAVVNSKGLFPAEMFQEEAIVINDSDSDSDVIEWEQAEAQEKQDVAVASSEVEAEIVEEEKKRQEEIVLIDLDEEEESVEEKESQIIEIDQDIQQDALDSAIKTASNLTQWAAGAVRRAVKEHRKGGDSPQASSPHQTESQIPTMEASESPSRHPLHDEMIKPVSSAAELQDEEAEIRRVLKRQRRDVDGISEEMVEEVMYLLQVLGVPYLVSPMEAEAQCAALEELGLVDGVITDDSDIFAFGGQHVYRNIFNNSKHVEAYLAKDIEQELGFTRQDIISFALLLGSDYTAGINGIGIVNASEVITAFPGFDGLKEFKEWVCSFNPFEKTKPSVSDKKQHFKHTHSKIRQKWEMLEHFPNQHVIDAYLHPQVNSSKDPFSWSPIDTDRLCIFAENAFGWSKDRTNDMLKPLEKASSAAVQMPLEHYFQYDDHVKYAKIKSKRLKKAVS